MSTCQLVNCLSGGDLCILPPGHAGEHQLSTMSMPGPLDPICFPMAPDRPGGKLWPAEYLEVLGKWLGGVFLHAYELDRSPYLAEDQEVPV